MGFKYKIDILQALKEKGYSTYRLRKEKIIAESTIQYIRNNELLGTDTILLICKLLECQPGDIIEYIPDKEDE